MEYKESEDFKHKNNDDDSGNIDSDDNYLNDIDFNKFLLDEDNSDEQKLDMKLSTANISLCVKYDEEAEETTLCVSISS